METANSKIKQLVNEIASTARFTFGDRCTAVYVMGSLARGGFSESASDIDIGIILEDPLLESDLQCVEQIQTDALKKHLAVKNQVSIFWGSIESLNGVHNSGRYPPFDRLDLIDHALLLAGDDVRAKLLKPSKQELMIAGTEFALDYLGSKESIDGFFDYESFLKKGPVHISKTVLFPARFIYLERTSEIAGNDVSYQFYMDHFSGPDADLVENGYQWRFNSFPDDKDRVVELLDKGLGKLYQNFIGIYAQQMDFYGENDLKNRLIKWKQNITSACSRIKMPATRAF